MDEVALFFSIFLGWAGIDRFYLKHYFTGILKLITLGFFGFWWVIDIFLILGGQLKEVGEGEESEDDLFGL